MCTALPELRSGRIDYDNLLENSTAEFVCDDAYRRMGVSSITCRRDGTWSSGPPTCLHVWLHVLLPFVAFVAVAAVCVFVVFRKD